MDICWCTDLSAALERNKKECNYRNIHSPQMSVSIANWRHLFPVQAIKHHREIFVTWLLGPHVNRINQFGCFLGWIWALTVPLKEKKTSISISEATEATNALKATQDAWKSPDKHRDLIAATLTSNLIRFFRKPARITPFGMQWMSRSGLNHMLYFTFL